VLQLSCTVDARTALEQVEGGGEAGPPCLEPQLPGQRAAAVSVRAGAGGSTGGNPAAPDDNDTSTETTDTGSIGGIELELGEIVVESNDTSNTTASADDPAAAADSGNTASATVKAYEDDGRGVHSLVHFSAHDNLRFPSV